MNHRKFALALGGSLLMGLGSAASAGELENIRAELRATQNRVAELEGKQSATWLDQRRAEEVKALIREVLSDADTRASLMADGAVAGHNGKNFYLGSADGSFQLRISGGIQVRYVHNFENTPAVVTTGTAGGNDSDDGGFDVARTKVNLAGHITAGRKWDYEVGLALGSEPDTTSGDVEVEDVKIGTALSDQIRVDAGKFKLAFLREELTSYSRQTAVERSLTNEFFTLGRSEQIQISYKSDMLLLRAAISDGANNGAGAGSATGFSAVGADVSEFAVTARADFKFSGDWSQADDLSAWSGQPTGIFAGAAIHYELGDGNQGAAGTIPSHGDYLSWTIDGSLEMNGLGVYAAVIGGHVDADATGVGGANESRDMFGIVAQVSYNINDQIEPFVRADWTDGDDNAGAGIDSTVLTVTFGANYYFAKSHDAKLTLDVMWIVDGPENLVDLASNNFGGPSANSNNLQGLSTGDAQGEDSVIVRVQFQLLY